MTGMHLLILGLICLAVVLAVTVRTMLVAWRVLKHSRQMAATTAEFSDLLARRSDEINERIVAVATAAGEMTGALERLKASLLRLQIIGQTIYEASEPYRRLRLYFGK